MDFRHIEMHARAIKSSSIFVFRNAIKELKPRNLFLVLCQNSVDGTATLAQSDKHQNKLNLVQHDPHYNSNLFSHPQSESN